MLGLMLIHVIERHQRSRSSTQNWEIKSLLLIRFLRLLAGYTTRLILSVLLIAYKAKSVVCIFDVFFVDFVDKLAWWRWINFTHIVNTVYLIKYARSFFALLCCNIISQWFLWFIDQYQAGNLLWHRENRINSLSASGGKLKSMINIGRYLTTTKHRKARPFV